MCARSNCTPGIGMGYGAGITGVGPFEFAGLDR